MKKWFILLLAALLLLAVACKNPSAAQDPSAEDPSAQAPQDDTGKQDDTTGPEPTRPPAPAEPEYEPLPDEMKPLAERIAGEWFADVAGLTVPLTLNDDGSYTLTLPGEAQKTGKWETADGLLLLDGNADDALVPVNGVLRWESADLLFLREKQEGYVQTEVIADAKEGAFDGWWKAQFVGVGEGTMLALFGARLGSEILEGAIADGALTFTAGGATVKLQLQTDGFLRLTLDGAEPVVLYLIQMVTPEQAAAENP